jgi:hypothetical protein
MIYYDLYVKNVISRGADLTKLVQEVDCTDPSPTIRLPCSILKKNSVAQTIIEGHFALLFRLILKKLFSSKLPQWSDLTGRPKMLPGSRNLTLI